MEGSVKETVRPYLLTNLVKTYKSEISKHLVDNQELDGQKYLLSNLRKESSGSDPIEKIILDSANLVAGTMIGILQHPDIKAQIQGASFDVLIIDEASKVTFSEFIVPALHAKKWILVGDVKQLSPYVEDDYVGEYIANLLDVDKQKTLVDLFELKSKLDDNRFIDCLKVCFTEHDPVLAYKLLDRSDLKIEILDKYWQANDINIAKLNAADVLIAKDDRFISGLISKYISVKSIFINKNTTKENRNHIQKYSKGSLKRNSNLLDNTDHKWSEMVASRLSQSFSFRKTDGFEDIDKELEYLIPFDLKDKIEKLKRLVFPSILELLQNGIGKGKDQRATRIFSHGFDEECKLSRFVSLTYQHRMHPAIAQTSKDNFYDGNNLQPANTVIDREWGFEPKEPVKWVSNNDDTGNKGDKIINPTELNDIKVELEKFLEWALNNPKPDGSNYEVAVLSFYLNQEADLRKMIRKLTNQHNCYAKLHKDNTDIYLYTVDKFQGQEADLVLLGFTKFTPNAHYNSPNRLNVALTRARHKLILFGNKQWFEEKAKLKALRDLASNFKSTLKIGK